MYLIKPSSRYKKSLKRIVRNPNFRLEELEVIIETLSRGTQLPVQYRDHELKGEYVGIRECHIRSDLLLVYKREKEELILLLLDIGTHSTIFGG